MMLHPDDLHTWNDLLPEDVRETMRTRSKERMETDTLPALPTHLLPALRDGRRRLAERVSATIELPQRQTTEEARTFAEFVAFARDDLREEGLADYIDTDALSSVWFGPRKYVYLACHVPGSVTLHVCYTKRDDGSWMRDVFSFPDDRYRVGNWTQGRSAATLGEALAMGEMSHECRAD